MPIHYTYKNTDFRLPNTDFLNQWLNSVILTEGKKLGIITFILVDDNSLLEINKKYLNHSYNTDVITFDSSFLDTICGDIFISVDTVKRNWKAYNSKSYKNELYRTMVHGILHLIGYTDNVSSEKFVMSRKEDMYLELLK